MKQNLAWEITNVVREVVKNPSGNIALHEPMFNGNEWRYVKECLDTRWVSSVGKYVDLFEKKLVDYTGVKHAVVVINGTAALYVSLLLAGVEENDEVLLPALTFIATANVVTYCRAVPHFVDVDNISLGVDPQKLDSYLKEITLIKNKQCFNKFSKWRIKALIVVHTFGHPVDLGKVKQVCKRYHLVLIEDAAEAIGSFYKGKHVGSAGELSILSFNGNKTITTGGGGAILTNSKRLAVLAKYLTTIAKKPHSWRYFHNKLGFNYRMPNINAALGCAQLEQLDVFLEKKRNLAHRYQQAFKNVLEIKFFEEPKYAKSNYWLNTIILERKFMDQRNEILDYSNSHEVMTRPCWEPMTSLPMYKNCPTMDLSTTKDLAKRIINIPSSIFL